MGKKYSEYDKIDFPKFEKEILAFWKEQGVFQKSVDNRNNNENFIFYEGPPSANGMPGIHHVMARAVKDTFCRYKTLQGFKVDRKGGWDTHGLPVELQVEKELKITKEDIGKKISIADYNKACRETVMRYKEVWNNLTERMGYWVDLDHPYITYENNYIESLWHLLKMLYDKGLIYKGYTIQPYSPAAGTGLSSHELNQPGTYKDVKDNTAVAMFKVSSDNRKITLPSGDDIRGAAFLAWTTTPWTLPSNTALAVGKNIYYNLIKTVSPHTGEPVSVILAKDLTSKYFKEEGQNQPAETFKAGDKILPWTIKTEFQGSQLEGIKYEPLFSYSSLTHEEAYRVVIGDFVTTEDGTGIVHIAPSFGADDFRVAKQNNIQALTFVDKRGKFTDEVADFAGEYVKEQYLTVDERNSEIERLKNLPDNSPLNKLISEIVTRTNEYLSVDERIILKLQLVGKLFKKEKYEHTYPHCWRTDKPILYYPLDSWFIKTTAKKEDMIRLNKTINWKPKSTGEGRFGNWLENLQDWNLSRSRYWGTPLPIWRTEDGTEEICIGSIEELFAEINKANTALGLNQITNKENLDLHRPYVDDIILVSESGKQMKREADLIDVWFDSGAMPYAQLHYPFENKELIDKRTTFPADFIAEGVDQTRGWFFTLHAISSMLFDSVAYKNVISNGLVLDRKGEKMSKSKGNVEDPFKLMDKYGIDALRWYMMFNGDPWDNLKFDTDGVEEVQRKFFGTLYNVYGFFALYANIDNFTYAEAEVTLDKRTEIDQWVLSLLNSLVANVQKNMDDYEPTKATRLIYDFVTEHLSNWYVRLCRRRFWKGEYTEDKIAAYQTLYTCLETVALLMSPISPFYADKLFTDLNNTSGRNPSQSVHLANFPVVNQSYINKGLELRMQLAQDVSSLVLSIRKKANIRVRQPLERVVIPVLNAELGNNLELVKDIIASEVNVKTIEMATDENLKFNKKIKANFKLLGAKLGAQMKLAANAIATMGQAEINQLEQNGSFDLNLGDSIYSLQINEVEILSEDVPGWQVASNGRLTVALDIHISDELKLEGLARELVNRLQNQRKTQGFDVTDRVIVHILPNDTLQQVIEKHGAYICNEILAEKLLFNAEISESVEVDLEDFKTAIRIDLFKN